MAEKIYDAMRLHEAEFECLEAISIEGYSPRETFYSKYEAVSAFPPKRVDEALANLHAKRYIELTPFSIMLTSKGKRVIEFDESTSHFE